MCEKWEAKYVSGSAYMMQEACKREHEATLLNVSKSMYVYW